MTSNNKEIICWVFNPYMLEVSSRKFATVHIGNSERKYAINPNHKYIDISDQLQGQFMNVDTERFKPLTVNCEGNSITLNSMWGGLSYEEHYGLSGIHPEDHGEEYFKRNLTYFAGYPFKIDLLLLPGTIKIRHDETRYGEEKTIDAVNFISYDINDKNLPDFKEWLIIRNDISESRLLGTFDFTFDYTFHKIPFTSVLTTVKKENRKCGTYLRWVDHYGFMNYYLFYDGEKEVATTKEKGFSELETPITLQRIKNKRLCEMHETTKINLCAINVDVSESLIMMDIKTSPLLDMYIGQSENGKELWVPVYIDGGVTKIPCHHEKRKFDIEFKIELPSRPLQRI